MTCQFVFPFSMFCWGDEGTMQVLRWQKDLIPAPFNLCCKGERATACWILAYDHKTQSFMKKGSQRKLFRIKSRTLKMKQNPASVF